MPVGLFDLAVIGFYFGLVLVIGYRSMRRVATFDDYALAGRSLPVALLFATMVATATGGAATIGRAAQAYESGIVIFAATVGFVSNQLLAGLIFAPRIRALGDLYTVADVMAFYYGRSGRFLTAVIAFVYSISLFGIQVLAMGRILQTVTGWPLVPLAVAGSAITVLYTWVGGFWAVVYTDFLQFVVLATGITTAALVAVHRAGGIEGLAQGLDPLHLSVTGNWSATEIAAVFIAFLLGEALAPYFVQRYLATRSPADTRRGVTLFGSYYGFYTIVVIALGLAGVVLLGEIEPDLVLTTVVREFLPVGLRGAVFAALLAAVMSTGDSILNNASVIFTRDLYQQFFRPDASDEAMLRWSKLTTLILGAGGVAVALVVPDVFGLLVYTYTLWAPSVIPPLVVALLRGGRRPVASSAAAPAMVAGGVATFVWGPRVLAEPFGIPAVAAGILVNLAVLFGVHFYFAGRAGGDR